MSRVICIIIFSVSLTLLSACGNWDKEIVANRAHLEQMRKGMTKEEVMTLMGPPIEGQKYCRPDVWFYYTNCKWSDSMITNDECTPVVFRDGKVWGWGQDFYKENVLFKPW